MTKDLYLIHSKIEVHITLEGRMYSNSVTPFDYF